MAGTATGSMRPHDVIFAVGAVDAALRPHLALDWEAPAGAGLNAVRLHRSGEGVFVMNATAPTSI
jgi:hypothetical protein